MFQYSSLAYAVGGYDLKWFLERNLSIFSGPTKHFPVFIVNHILKDVLTSYLQEEQYEPELCRQMTKTISEVMCDLPKVLSVSRVFAESTIP